MNYEVLQKDREAVVAIAPLFGLPLDMEDRKAILAGEKDDDERVQFLARHRFHRPAFAKYDFAALGVNSYLDIDLPADPVERIKVRDRVHSAACQWKVRTGKVFQCQTLTKKVRVTRLA